MKEQPECEVDEWGNIEWWLNGRRHREDGPAIKCTDGRKWWFLHDKLHREDGPAFENKDGYKEWWLNDEEVHPETLVDLHLSRGTFCYYDKQSNELRFEE